MLVSLTIQRKEEKKGYNIAYEEYEGQIAKLDAGGRPPTARIRGSQKGPDTPLQLHHQPLV